MDKELIHRIRTAFAGVKLGSGVGLFEGQAMDDYSGGAELARCRAKDEREDWTRLTDSDLTDNEDALAYFDPEGMRFHLPAFLIMELKGGITNGLIFNLTPTRNEEYEQFSMLSADQRECVRLYLRALATREAEVLGDDLNIYRDDVARGLEGYWSEKNDPPDARV